MSSPNARDFASLTYRGRLRRLRPLAVRALRAYDIPVQTVTFHSFATNLLYRVQSATGERYMLRLAVPGWRTAEDLRAEAAWLDALQADTDIGAPLARRAANGEAVLAMEDPGVPDTWHATLMTWIEGRLLTHHLTPQNLERMGELSARLHIHGKAWQPPAGFTEKRFDAFLSRGEPNVLFSDAIQQNLSSNDRRAYCSARAWVEQGYAQLDPDDLRVIHCDLWHENIKLHHGRLHPFDFEDTIWGFRLHDIAMGMLDLLETVGTARYESLLASFRCGYERYIPWPQGNLAVLQIGRLLWIANYVARFEPEHFPAFAQKQAQVFREYERTGELRVH